MQLENDLIKILKKNKPIFKKTIMQLIESKDPIKIKKCFNYLEDDNHLFLSIINNEKSILLDYFRNQEGTKLEFKDSFNIEDKNELITIFNMDEENNLLPYINFKPENFKLIINEKDILSFVIKNINKENDQETWNEKIKENINDLIKGNKLMNKELLVLINSENDMDKKKKYLTIDVFDGIDINCLKDDYCFNEFKKINLIKIFLNNNEKSIDKIISFITKANELHKNIENILEEIISQLNHIDDISTFIYKISKRDDKNHIILDFIMKKINIKFKSEIMEIYLKIENKDLSKYCRDIFIKYIFDGDKIENIIKLLNKSENKEEIFTRIDGKLIEKNNIESILNFKKLFKEFSKDKSLEDKINEVIYKKIKNLKPEERLAYFLKNEIYVNKDNINIEKRTLDILDGFDISLLIKLNENLKTQKNTIYNSVI
jgi:K+/H+ antiporter YhaU regulatory subunit KhtT